MPPKRDPAPALITSFAIVLALVIPAGVSGQASVLTEGGAVEILGPPPPSAPDVVSRDGQGGATIRAVRVTEPVRIDGVLDETFYGTLPSVSDFLQSGPGEGDPATERTEAWIVFDDDTRVAGGNVSGLLEARIFRDCRPGPAALLRSHRVR